MRLEARHDVLDKCHTPLFHSVIWGCHALGGGDVSKKGCQLTACSEGLLQADTGLQV